MTIMKAWERFSTVTPCLLTTSGSLACAWLTRFCTFTWAMSGSVPGSKVTVRVMLPVEELVEDM